MPLSSCRANVGIQARHAHVDAWLPRLLARVCLHEAWLVEDPLRAFDDVDVIMASARHAFSRRKRQFAARFRLGSTDSTELRLVNLAAGLTNFELAAL